MLAPVSRNGCDPKVGHGLSRQGGRAYSAFISFSRLSALSMYFMFHSI